MAKNNSANPATACICNKCGIEVKSSIPGKSHRKCGGQQGAKPRPHGDYIPGAERGEWEAQKED